MASIPRGPAGSGLQLGTQQAGALAVANIAKLNVELPKLAKAVQPAIAGLNGLATGAKILGASLTGLVYFGARGTAELNRLTYEMQRAARELANSFAPTIRAVTDGFAHLADFFHAMTGPQQQFVRNLTLGTIAAGGISIGFLKLQAAVTALGTALAAARLQYSVAGASGAGATGFALAGVVGLLTATKEGRETLLELGKALQPLLQVAAQLATIIGQALIPASQFLAGAMSVLVEGIRWAAEQIKKAVAPLAEADEIFMRFIRNMDVGELQRRHGEATGRAKTLVEEELARRGAAVPGKRDALTLATAGGAEDPRNILQRLQVAANKTDYQRKTADETAQVRAIANAILEWLKRQQGAPRKEVAQ